MNNQTGTAEACCTTSAAVRWWTILFVAALVPLIVVAVYWHPFSGAATPFAAGIACVGNWQKNRTYHCRISGPIFFIAGAVLLVAGMQLVRVNSGFVWILAGVGVLVSFLLEWRYAKRPGRTTK